MTGGSAAFTEKLYPKYVVAFTTDGCFPVSLKKLLALDKMSNPRAFESTLNNINKRLSFILLAFNHFNLNSNSQKIWLTKMFVIWYCVVVARFVQHPLMIICCQKLKSSSATHTFCGLFRFTWALKSPTISANW